METMMIATTAATTTSATTPPSSWSSSSGPSPSSSDDDRDHDHDENDDNEGDDDAKLRDDPRSATTKVVPLLSWLAMVLPIVGCGIPPEVYHRMLEDIVVLLER